MRQACLLESGRGGSFSMAGLDHVAELIGKDHLTDIFYRDGSSERAAGKPLDARKIGWLDARQSKTENFLTFKAGQWGLSAMIMLDILKICLIPQKMISIHRICTYLVFDEVAVFDHQEKAALVNVHM